MHRTEHTCLANAEVEQTPQLKELRKRGSAPVSQNA